ncbi:hypothetical protein AB0J83_17590 [Actinoplanes sp. NPDC049596]|uniref:WXG100-like domain-containing protein n=1 Tax=unclassified Actinoplanes TaxID=2626549 RepID=UPI0034308D39
MALEASDELNRFQLWLSGEQFPSANEDRLRAQAQAYDDAANAIETVIPMFAAAVSDIRSGVSGESERAFADAMEKYVGDNGLLTFSGKYVHRLGSGMDDLATQVEYTKLMIIVILIELLIEFLSAMAVAWLFPGIMAQLTARLLVGRSMILAWLVRLGVSVASAELIGISMQVLMDLIVQEIQIQAGHRKGVDRRNVVQAVEVGALGGAIGLTVGELGALVSKLAQHTGVVLPHGAGIEYVEHVSHESASEFVTEGTWSEIQGGTWDLGASIGGLLSGSASASVEFAGERAGTALRKATGMAQPGEFADHESPVGDEPDEPFPAPPPSYPEALAEPAYLPPLGEAGAGAETAESAPPPRYAETAAGADRPRSVAAEGPVADGRSADAISRSSIPGRPEGRSASGSILSSRLRQPVTEAVVTMGGVGEDPRPVPRILHMVVAGPEPVTTEVRSHIRSWATRAAAEGWSVRVWVDQAAAIANPDLAGVLGRQVTVSEFEPPTVADAEPAQPARPVTGDVMAITVLHEHGGVLVDVTVPPAGVRLPDVELVMGTGPADVPFFGGSIQGRSVVGHGAPIVVSPPRTAFLDEARRAVLQPEPVAVPASLTGPSATMVAVLTERHGVDVAPDPALAYQFEPHPRPAEAVDAPAPPRAAWPAPHPSPGSPIPSALADDEAARAAHPELASMNPESTTTSCVLTAIVLDMNLEPGEAMTWNTHDAGPLPLLDLVNYQRQQLDLADDQSRLYRMDVASIRAALAVHAGARGIVIAGGPDAVIRHAFNVVHDEHGVSFLDGQRAGLARLPRGGRDLIFVPLTPQVADLGAPSVEPHELAGLVGGLIGVERQLEALAIGAPRLSGTSGKVLLLSARNGLVKVYTDWGFRFEGTDGRFYGDRSHLPPGVGVVRLTPFLVPEIVTAPWTLLRGEYGNIAADVRQTENVIRAALMSSDGRTLSEIFRGNNAIKVHKNWAIHQSGLFPHGNSVMQHVTVGVPIAAGPGIMAELLPLMTPGTSTTIAEEGIRFGNTVAQRYLRFAGWGEQTGDRLRLALLTNRRASSIFTVTALAYMHAAAEAYSRGRGRLVKQAIPLALRESLLTVRNLIHPEAQSFLMANRSVIRSDFVDIFLRRRPRFMQEHGNPGQSPVDVVLDGRLPQDPITPGMYLDQLLSGQSPAYDQTELFSIAPVQPSVGRAGGDYLAIVEIRNIGAHQNWYSTEGEADHNVRLISELMQRGDVQANLMMASENPADAVAVGIADTVRGLLTNGPAYASAWAANASYWLSAYAIRGHEQSAHARMLSALVAASLPAAGGVPAPDGRAGAAASGRPVGSALSAAEMARAFPWLSGVNPDRGRGGEYLTNCVVTAIATDLSLREGVLHEAPPASALPVEDLVNYQNQVLGRPGARFVVSDFAELTEVLGRSQEGNRGVVVVRGAGEEISHAFNMIVGPEGVSYLDGQSGGPARRPDDMNELFFLPLTDGAEVLARDALPLAADSAPTVRLVGAPSIFASLRSTLRTGAGGRAAHELVPSSSDDLAGPSGHLSTSHPIGGPDHRSYPRRSAHRPSGSRRIHHQTDAYMVWRRDVGTLAQAFDTTGYLGFDSRPPSGRSGDVLIRIAIAADAGRLSADASEVWLSADHLDQAFIADLTRVGTLGRRQRLAESSVQGQRLRDLVDGVVHAPDSRLHPSARPRIPVDHLRAAAVGAARAANVIQNRRPLPGTPLVTSAHHVGSPAFSTAPIGISYLTRPEHELFSTIWPTDPQHSYRVDTGVDGAPEHVRALPFTLDEQMFVVLTHASQYGLWMSTNRDPAPSVNRYVDRLRDYLPVNGGTLAQHVLADPTYQQHLRRWGTRTSILLTACRALPDAQAFARSMGRTVWASDGFVTVQTTTLGLQQQGRDEPRWYQVLPDGSLHSVTPRTPNIELAEYSPVQFADVALPSEDGPPSPPGRRDRPGRPRASSVTHHGYHPAPHGEQQSDPFPVDVMTERARSLLSAALHNPGGDLARWIDTAGLDSNQADCLPLAWAAYITRYGRAGNKAVTGHSYDDFLEALGGRWSPGMSPRHLLGVLREHPGSSALIHERTSRSHLFWLMTDPDGTVRVVDPQTPGRYRTPYAYDVRSNDAWTRALHSPDSRVMLVDAGGRPFDKAAGQPPGDAARFGPQPPVRLRSQDLTALVDRVVTTTKATAGLTLADCVTLLSEVQGGIYANRQAIGRPVGAVDDSAVGTGRVEDRLAPGGSWSAAASWSDIETAVRRSGPGSTALVLARYQSGIGHAFALHHTIDDGDGLRWIEPHNAPGDRLIGAERLRVAGQTRFVVLDAAGHAVPVAPRSSTTGAGALIDVPPHLSYGRGGLEVEVHSAYVEIPDGVHDQPGMPVAWHEQTGVQVVLDTGTFYGLIGEESLHQESALLDRTRLEPETYRSRILEFVNRYPFQVLRHEHAVVPNPALDLIRRVTNRLERRGPNRRTRLTDLLPSRDGWTLSAEFDQAAVISVDPGGIPDLAVHYTMGVPLRAVNQFLRYLEPGIHPETPYYEWQRTIVRDATRFSTAVGDVLSDFHDSLRSGDRADIEGLLALTYVVGATQLFGPILEVGLARYLMAAAPRHNLLVVRNQLSDRARALLGVHREQIAAAFDDRILEAMPEFESRERATFAIRHRRALRPHREHRARELFDYVISGNPPPHGWNIDSGVHTQFADLDASRGPARPPLVLLEIRSMAGGLADMLSVEQYYAQVSDMARQATDETEGHARPWVPSSALQSSSTPPAHARFGGNHPLNRPPGLVGTPEFATPPFGGSYPRPRAHSVTHGGPYGAPRGRDRNDPSPSGS